MRIQAHRFVLVHVISMRVDVCIKPEASSESSSVHKQELSLFGEQEDF